MKIPGNLMSLITSPISIYANAIDGLIGEVVARVKSGEKAIMPIAKMVGVQSSSNNAEETSEKMVLVIPVFKFISKQDIEDYGILGTQTIQALIVAANADDNILGVVLHINNPGGTVMNTTETARDIFKSVKPVVAFCEDLSASSGYYLTAACKYVFASGPTALIGNIGTKSQGLDLSGILEKLGAKSWEIFAKESFDKDLGFTEAMAGKPEKYPNSILAPYAKMFMDDVKMMRPQIAEDATHGMIYVADTALEKGLIDAIGSLDDAISKVVELSSTTQNSQTNLNKNMTKVTMSVPVAMRGAVKALGGEEVTAQTENPDVSAALTALITSSSAQITALEAQVSTLTAEKTTAEAKVVPLEAKVTELTGKVTTLTSEVTTLKANTPAALRSKDRQNVLEGEQSESANPIEAVDAKVAAAEAEIEAEAKANRWM